jgi:hypothetical protein
MAVRHHGFITDEVLDMRMRVGNPYLARSSLLLGNSDREWLLGWLGASTTFAVSACRPIPAFIASTGAVSDIQPVQNFLPAAHTS